MVKSKKYSTQARFAPTLSPIYEENTLSISEVDLVFDEDDFILESRRQSKESAERRKLASSQKHKIRNFFVYAIILFCIVAFGFFLVRRVLEGRRKEEDFLNGKEGSIANTDLDSNSASSLDGPRLDATVGKEEPKRSKKTSTNALGKTAALKPSPSPTSSSLSKTTEATDTFGTFVKHPLELSSTLQTPYATEGSSTALKATRVVVVAATGATETTVAQITVHRAETKAATDSQITRGEGGTSNFLSTSPTPLLSLSEDYPRSMSKPSLPDASPSASLTIRGTMVKSTREGATVSKYTVTQSVRAGSPKTETSMVSSKIFSPPNAVKGEGTTVVRYLSLSQPMNSFSHPSPWTLMTSNAFSQGLFSLYLYKSPILHTVDSSHAENGAGLSTESLLAATTAGKSFDIVTKTTQMITASRANANQSIVLGDSYPSQQTRGTSIKIRDETRGIYQKTRELYSNTNGKKPAISTSPPFSLSFSTPGVGIASLPDFPSASPRPESRTASLKSSFPFVPLSLIIIRKGHSATPSVQPTTSVNLTKLYTHTADQSLTLLKHLHVSITDRIFTTPVEISATRLENMTRFWESHLKQAQKSSKIEDHANIIGTTSLSNSSVFLNKASTLLSLKPRKSPLISTSRSVFASKSFQSGTQISLNWAASFPSFTTVSKQMSTKLPFSSRSSSSQHIPSAPAQQEKPKSASSWVFDSSTPLLSTRRGLHTSRGISAYPSNTASVIQTGTSNILNKRLSLAKNVASKSRVISTELTTTLFEGDTETYEASKIPSSEHVTLDKQNPSFSQSPTTNSEMVSMQSDSFSTVTTPTKTKITGTMLTWSNSFSATTRIRLYSSFEAAQSATSLTDSVHGTLKNDSGKGLKSLESSVVNNKYQSKFMSSASASSNIIRNESQFSTSLYHSMSVKEMSYSHAYMNNSRVRLLKGLSTGQMSSRKSYTRRLSRIGYSFQEQSSTVELTRSIGKIMTLVNTTAKGNHATLSKYLDRSKIQTSTKASLLSSSLKAYSHRKTSTRNSTHEYIIMDGNMRIVNMNFHPDLNNSNTTMFTTLSGNLEVIIIRILGSNGTNVEFVRVVRFSNGSVKVDFSLYFAPSLNRSSDYLASALRMSAQKFWEGYVIANITITARQVTKPTPLHPGYAERTSTNGKRSSMALTIALLVLSGLLLGTSVFLLYRFGKKKKWFRGSQVKPISPAPNASATEIQHIHHNEAFGCIEPSIGEPEETSINYDELREAMHSPFAPQYSDESVPKSTESIPRNTNSIPMSVRRPNSSIQPKERVLSAQSKSSANMPAFR